jgi:hypothetical protein
VYSKANAPYNYLPLLDARLSEKDAAAMFEAMEHAAQR